MMDPPSFLLDAFEDSITSGTFIDTKFYVFSRRDVSGRCIDSPRPLYCNSRVLDTVPYFSTLFSNRFSEGQERDINEGFPADSSPYTEEYDYLSDSDLEDESSCFVDRGNDWSEPPSCSQDPIFQSSPTPASESLQRSLSTIDDAEGDNRSESGPRRMGKVAVIRDMAAVTFEAMIYFLYTGKIAFAPFTSDPHHKLSAETRTGDWDASRLPSPSAKSIYRLADKYDIPTLKELARTHICNNLAHCSIVDEIFSSFSALFPEILSVQIAQLLSKVKEESTGANESPTKKQLLDRMASLQERRLPRASGVLDKIIDDLSGPLDLPVPNPDSTSSTNPAPFSWSQRMLFSLSSNSDKMKLALLKSIPTGTFIDVQLHAYNTIDAETSLPLNLKPLFTSSIVIKEWEAAITTQTVGEGPETAHVADGFTDDYESRKHELPEVSHRGEGILKYRTEATTDESRDVVIVASGAWKTWHSLLSYAYTNKMTFAPLLTSIRDDPPADTGVRSSKVCSPRSMYSLAVALGIKTVEDMALKSIQSKLTISNIAQELFTSFAANHKAVMDMEIEFFRGNLTEQNAKLLKDHIQKMASNDAPFYPTTLSLVYRVLVEKAFPQQTTSSASDHGQAPEAETGGGSLAEPVPAVEGTDSASNKLGFFSKPAVRWILALLILFFFICCQELECEASGCKT